MVRTVHGAFPESCMRSRASATCAAGVRRRSEESSGREAPRSRIGVARLSRAFVKDDDDGPEPTFERPASASPNYVTPRGLELLQKALVAARSAGNDRDARYYRERVDSAIVIGSERHARGVVEFGATVRAHDSTGRELRVRIVGEDEADPRAGLISWQSPVARAFTGHRAGDRVVVDRPAGRMQYTIDNVTYE